MTHTVELPALDGRKPLGFLAALGVVALIPEARLSFHTETATATLHSHLPDCDTIAEALADIVAGIPDNATLPDTPSAFPIYRTGTKGSDPMRMPRNQYRAYATQHPDTHTWLAATVTDLAIDSKKHISQLTHLMAPGNLQSVSSFFSYPLAAVRKNPEYLHQALTAWQRIEGITGESLDHHVNSSAADHPTGESTNTGVPGATWLATQALALFRVTSTKPGTRHTTAWHYHQPTKTPYLIWPLWRQPLSATTIPTLLEHPTLQPDPQQPILTLTARPHQLNELGVFHLNAARRQPLDNAKSAGVLTPHPIHTNTP